MKLINLSYMVLAILFGALFSSCSKDPKSTGFQFFPDMVSSVAYEAFSQNEIIENRSSMMLAVKGTIARGHMPYHYGKTRKDAERAGRELKNPFPVNNQLLARGKELYSNFCVVCHGPKGDGKGPLMGKFPSPPPFYIGAISKYSAGRIFHVITRGSIIMPSHAAQIYSDDRWAVAEYVKTLQKK